MAPSRPTAVGDSVATFRCQKVERRHYNHVQNNFVKSPKVSCFICNLSSRSAWNLGKIWMHILEATNIINLPPQSYCLSGIIGDWLKLGNKGKPAEKEGRETKMGMAWKPKFQKHFDWDFHTLWLLSCKRSLSKEMSLYSIPKHECH